MSGDGRKALALAVAVLTLGGLLLAGGPKLLGLAGGPENEIVTRLKEVERAGFEVPVAGGILRGAALQYQRLSVAVDEGGERAVATGTLDLTGDFNRTTAVSSLGLERIVFERRDGEWSWQAGPAPRLAAIVEALELRRRDQEHPVPVHDAGSGLVPAHGRRYEARAWYIRSEREGAEVAEDYRLTGMLPDRPLDEKATVRLELIESPKGRFILRDGLE